MRTRPDSVVGVLTIVDDRPDCCPHCGLTPEAAEEFTHAIGCPNDGVEPELVPDIRIEYPARGSTYRHDRYGAYEYDVYPESSVLAGQTRRRFLGEYDTLEDARRAHPGAYVVEGSCFAPPSLSHLFDREDI